MLSAARRQMIRVILVLILLACYHNSIRVRTYLLLASLLPHHCSPWQKLYNAGNESLLFHITGLTQEAFDALLNFIIPPGHVICRPRWARPLSLPPDRMLGLLLCYLGSQMSNKWLCLIFGITPLPCSRILKMILRMTVKRLRYHPLARVKFPNVEKMQLFSDMISVWEPTVNNVIGFMDGLGLITECTDERITQNAYYCGYDCYTMVNNILVFGPDGKVFFLCH